MSIGPSAVNPPRCWPRRHRDCTAHTVAFGLSRSVPENTSMVTFENGQYSVPAHLLGAMVFVRAHGAGPDEQVTIVHHASQGPMEVAPPPPRPARQPRDRRRPLPRSPAQDPG